MMSHKKSISCLQIVVFASFIIMPLLASAGTCTCDDIAATQFSVATVDECVNQCGTLAPPANMSTCAGCTTGSGTGGGSGSGSGGLPNITGYPETTTDIYNIFVNVANWFIIFAIVISVITIIVAGFTYMTAGGDSEKVSKANKMMIYTVAGLIIALVAWGLVQVIINFLGITGITSDPGGL